MAYGDPITEKLTLTTHEWSMLEILVDNAVRKQREEAEAAAEITAGAKVRVDTSTQDEWNNYMEKLQDSVDQDTILKVYRKIHNQIAAAIILNSK